MKLQTFALSALVGLLPLSMATPAEPIEQEGDDSDLAKRGARSCKIVNLNPGDNVNCRYGPHLGDGEIFGIPAGEKRTFACYENGDCVKGVCTWDQITILGTTCYVNGYYTDSNCSSKKLPKCKD
ncbi:hypothetical protein NUU61_007149 [Penicillium alfredii]|uniref:Uncharacterized protein n=1 Tax=Penicillium alfredii TaxID=1506179 RepID=A0A9W9K414_9EURO|nr:uncharacterized protein NUU61_007149 [Penicillium alfredii]KAJ5092279.1 hypothetical protein NUU61_007149 [Penicillium alfredii]